MSQEDKIPLGDLITEALVRDFLLFLFIFLLILGQGWTNVLLLLFPLISFSFSIYFRLISTNKWRAEFDNKTLSFNPLGREDKNSNRLFFCTMLELVLIFWFGAESLYHPQLIDNYAIFFIGIFVFSYTFGFYWIFIDIWKYCNVELLIQGSQAERVKENEDSRSYMKKKVISVLKLRTFKLISIINLMVFLVLNGLNILIGLLTPILVLPGVQNALPGTGIEDSLPLTISFIIYGILVIPPILTIIFFKKIYNDISMINAKYLEKALESLPNEVQINIKENLKAINRMRYNRLVQ